MPLPTTDHDQRRQLSAADLACADRSAISSPSGCPATAQGSAWTTPRSWSLREQEELGLDILTDGEMRRTHFHFPYCRRLGRHRHRRTRHQDRSTAIAPPIAWCRASPARSCAAIRPSVDDLRAAKTHTARPLKMAVPGPMTVIDSASNEFYQDEEELAFDVAAAINGELRDLQAAGCAVLQIDEPAMTRYHDKVARLWREGARSLPRRHHGADHRASLLRLSGRRQRCSTNTNMKTCCRADADAHRRLPVEFGRSTFDPQGAASCAATASSCSAASIPATRRCRRSLRSSAASAKYSSGSIRSRSGSRPTAA